MKKSIQTPLVSELRAARLRMGLTQKELSERSALPQSHISNIENEQVDLRLNSLVSLSRQLGMELVLVPKIAVPAVRAIVQEFTHGQPADWDQPMYQLDDDEDDKPDPDIDDRPLFAQVMSPIRSTD